MWLDEEPPADIYTEALTRTNVGANPVWMTFTPLQGVSTVVPVAEETIAIEHRGFPSHWPRIGGMDFGWDHPFAAVELVWDRDCAGKL